METKKVGCFVVVVFTFFFGQEVLSPKNIKQSGSESASSPCPQKSGSLAFSPRNP